jgi:Raf kinase inhibitor-like YbhB/YbcL family protein
MNRFGLAPLALLLAACGSPVMPAGDAQEAAMTFVIKSTAFAEGEPIPAAYSCDGKGISPPLSWSEVPAGTMSFALIMDDPDAPSGTFVHWVIYNIPAASTSLPESLPKDAELADGSTQGPNSARRPGYTPPCPPGGTHRYFFKVYALNTVLTLAAAGKEELWQAMQGHILAHGELMGTYARR